MEFKEFALGNLFNIHTPIKRFNANAVKFGGIYPYVARGSSNNGIRGYITEDVKYLNPGNTLSFGQDTATVFYQKEAYFTGDKIKVMELCDYELNENLAVYLITCIRKAFSDFVWGQNSFNESVLKKINVLLPSKEDGTPDWAYMQDCIMKTMQGYVKEVDAYLSATGLNDCELTEADKQVLEIKPQWKEFLMNDVFDIVKGKRLTKEDQLPGNTLFIGATAENHGQTARIGQKPLFPANTITVSYNGSVGEAFYQEEPYWASDDINVLFLKDAVLNRRLASYLCAVIRKAGKLFYYNQKWNLERMKVTKISLPVTGENMIDWGYMERYICAMEKRAIAAVVKWKDRMVGEGLKGCQ